MRAFLLVTSLFAALPLFGQFKNKATVSYVLRDCHLVYEHTITIDFCGAPLLAKRKALVAKSVVERYHDFISRTDTVSNVIFLSYAYDSICTARDSLFSQIKNYLISQQNLKKSQLDSGYISLPLKSFLVTNVGPIAYSLNMGDGRPEIVFYLHSVIFKIKLLEESYGDLEAFLKQNFQLFVNEQLVSQIYYEKRIKEALGFIGIK